MVAWDFAGEEVVARSEGFGAAPGICSRAQSDAAGKYDDEKHAGAGSRAGQDQGASSSDVRGRSGRAAPDVAARPAGVEKSIGEIELVIWWCEGWVWAF